MSREDAQLKLRLPADLKARVEAAAEANKRSVNAQIVSLLEVGLNGGPFAGLTDQRLHDVFVQFNRRAAALEAKIEKAYGAKSPRVARRSVIHKRPLHRTEMDSDES
jgi:hypothetical protein